MYVEIIGRQICDVFWDSV